MRPMLPVRRPSRSHPARRPSPRAGEHDAAALAADRLRPRWRGGRSCVLPLAAGARVVRRAPASVADRSGEDLRRPRGPAAWLEQLAARRPRLGRAYLHIISRCCRRGPLWPPRRRRPAVRPQGGDHRHGSGGAQRSAPASRRARSRACIPRLRYESLPAAAGWFRRLLGAGARGQQGPVAGVFCVSSACVVEKCVRMMRQLPSMTTHA